MAKVTMPQLGESVAEGTIGRWLKQPGDTVAKYEPLLEVITDKVNAEVPSPFAGVLKEILAEEGAIVPNDAEIAVIETDDEAGPATGAAGRPAARGSRPRRHAEGTAAVEPGRAVDAAKRQPSNGPAGSDERPSGDRRQQRTRRPRPPAAAAPPPPPPRSPGATATPNARMTPAVRRLLREHGLEASQIAGTGGGGRITREDVLAYVEAVRTGPDARRAGRRGRRPAAAPRPRRRPPRAPPRPPRRNAGDRVPGRRGRGPPPDDPDAQGHRGADDPRAQRRRTRTSRWRSTRRGS